MIRSPAGKQAAALLEEWLAAGRDQFLAHGADSAWGRAYLEGARPAVLLVREIHPAIQDLAETAGVGGPGASGLTEITAVLGSIGFDGDDGGGDG